MEKAILKTLIYANIFDYPLKGYEIHKWLIGKQVSLRQIEKALDKLNQNKKTKRKKGYFFLLRRDGLVRKREQREKHSRKFLIKAKFCVWFLKIIPWIKLIGISGGLAMNNAGKTDDIDLILITSKNRLWLTRFLIIGILDFLRVRRKVKMKGNQVAGKLCINLLLEEDNLEQKNKDIYTAHEVLQMKILWERDGIYSKYLDDNSWAFKFLPNWIDSDMSLRVPPKAGRGNLIKNKDSHVASLLGMTMERLAKWIQLKIMRKPQGMERIEEGALYFHPKDTRSQVLDIYRQKARRFSSS